jgi:uncharacterized membrane protein YkoI
MNRKMLSTITALILVGAVSAQAQDTTSSQSRIRVTKDTGKTAAGAVVTPTSNAFDTLSMEWYTPTGTTCSSVDVSAARAVTIKSDLYTPGGTMISPDSAKVIALCAVPGQIGSGEMNVANGRTEYAIDIIPNGKKTHAKVIVDAQTGAVLSSKQFGGLRGLAGWVRESGEHKMNKAKSPTDTMTTTTRDTTMNRTNLRDTTMNRMNMRDTSMSTKRDTTKRDTTKVKRDTIPPR